ncbi:unnamed protein product [Diatraea saccharalis]|uniref:Major facilitator superfamily (MFS) profile domain-containing protein n=1 Tax=Diatraea saccharalis TaxID=40085 RepID=A0A9N9W8D8_9NEOP|nr:unnamed protein product [Diatraea saccharalis]
MGEQAERTSLFTKPISLELYPDLSQPITNELQQLTPSNDYKPGWSFYLILAGVATTLGLSLPVGYNIGVINTSAMLIKQFCNESVIAHYDVVLDKGWLDMLWSTVVSIFIIGGCTGSLLGAVLADYLGRKKSIITVSGLSIVGAMLFVFCRVANSVEMLLLGRLLVGLAAGLTTSIVPMYLTELAPLKLSGTMGIACPMGVNVGVLVGQVMGLNFLLGGVDDWPYLLSVYVLLVIFCLPMLFILPESPKYLFVIRRDEENALKVFSVRTWSC